LYIKLLKEYEVLKTENSVLEKEITSIKKSDNDIRKINESLRLNIKVLTNNLKVTKLLLKQMQKTTTKQIKLLSLNKSQTNKNQARKCLSSIFSTYQLNLIMKKKKRIHWTKNEISKAFILQYFIKRAYIYFKNEFHYPLFGK